MNRKIVIFSIIAFIMFVAICIIDPTNSFPDSFRKADHYVPPLPNKPFLMLTGQQILIDDKNTPCVILKYVDTESHSTIYMVVTKNWLNNIVPISISTVKE